MAREFRLLSSTRSTAASFLFPGKTVGDTKIPGYRQIFGAAATVLITAVIFNTISAEGQVSFNEYGVSAFFAQAGVIFLCPILVYRNCTSAVLRRAVSLGLAFLWIYHLFRIVLSFALLFVPSLVGVLGGYLPTLLLATLGAWVIVAAYRAGDLIAGSRSQANGIRSSFCFVAPFLLIPYQPVVYGDSTVWTRMDVWSLAQSAFSVSSDGAEPYEAVQSTDWEKILYAQTNIIQDNLDKIEPSRANGAQVFFIGMAPYSGQTVFSKEIAAAQAIMDKHFGTRQHSLTLENEASTTHSKPLANATSLQKIALGLKEKSKSDNDVLVLFITSHGSEDYLAVDSYPLSFNPITPASIKTALDASGFKNRVVILSACHAGSFIDDLQDGHTAILAAASAARTSFGCSNDRDWTYFGDALFNHALRETRSLRSAFEITEKLIATWEAEQKITPSEPQIFLGPDIEKAWAALMPSFDQSKSSPVKTGTHSASSR